MKNNEYALVISDMVRKEGIREGYALLEEIRKNDKEIPFIIYAGSKRKEHVDEAIKRGA